MRKYFYLPLLFLGFTPALPAQNFTSVNSTSNKNTVAVPLVPKAKIQIVFALDATGSMQGLIATAKDKIWSIATSITQATPAPDLELGLIFYRDRSDKFITKRVSLTDSIDMVYAELMSITAQGGGDGPESVNQALYEAVTGFAWDSSPHVYKSIFLIGDAPPHMDYKNDVQYPESCVLAKGKDIIINTIQMGNDAEAGRIWKLIAACYDGAYVKADMKVNDIKVTTPYDADIARINDSLENTHYYYGSAKAKLDGQKLKTVGNNIKSLSAVNVQAQRAEYKFNELAKTSSARLKTNDLIEDISNKVTDLAKVKEVDLPLEMQSMNAEERKKFVSIKLDERAALKRRLADKIKARNEYIRKELGKQNRNAVQTSFNNILFEKIKSQTARKNIFLEGEAKY